ncbi:MAG: HNH endonuclease signature motif containing protein [Candidatus Poribacteria bacterium]|nr:HNH endonuclease signature motif containing protein [Candidatus Poribacteria bacterium]
MRSERIPAALRRQVRERAQGLCEYCYCPVDFTNAAFHCEHIRPRDAGGETTLDNLAWSCPRCNAHKYTKTHARDAQTGRRVSLFNPRRQRWSRHFTWSEDFMFIIGRTATGRTTVEALHLNRAELLNLRRVLHAVGEHPPT